MLIKTCIHPRIRKKCVKFEKKFRFWEIFFLAPIPILLADTVTNTEFRSHTKEGGVGRAHVVKQVWLQGLNGSRGFLLVYSMQYYYTSYVVIVIAQQSYFVRYTIQHSRVLSNVTRVQSERGCCCGSYARAQALATVVAGAAAVPAVALGARLLPPTSCTAALPSSVPFLLSGYSGSHCLRITKEPHFLLSSAKRRLHD